ncbi:carbohydrate kinase family protein [Candidatus Collierbacteria bacterium]|nr:carbohydrate kinase family protein [Candidatus Collierbacteria bacterium]
MSEINKKITVAVTGTLGFDYIMDFPGKFADRIMPDKIHKISLSFLADTLKKQFGGTAGNIAYSLKLLGIEPRIISMAGNDFEPYKKFLLDKNIDISGISIRHDVSTSSYFVITDKDDNQIGSFYLGASKHAKNLSVYRKNAKPDFIIIAPAEPEAMKKYVLECRKLRLPYLYDPAFQVGVFSPDDLLKGISGAKILIGNDYEISLIEKKLKINHSQLLRLCPLIITTLGVKGSIIETSDKKITINSARPKSVVDPTGAGDAYRGGFLAGYLRGFDLKICGQMGAVAAAYTVEKYGTVTHTFSKNDFIKRYKQNYKGNLVLT